MVDNRQEQPLRRLSPASRRGRLLVVALLIMLGGQLALGLCLQEDAFISFRYARNLVDGNGLVYNVGERVEGYTNFLWTVILAGGMSLGLDPVPLARWLGVAASLALVILVFVIAGRWDRPRGRTGGLVAAAIVAASPSLASEGVQGLETVFFALLVTAGVALAVAARRREAAGGSGDPTGPGTRRLYGLQGLVLAVAALTRPEGAGVLALVTAGSLLWRFRQGRGRRWPLEFIPVLVFLAIYLPYWLWRFDYYGYPFPNTFYAKTGGGLRHLWRGMGYVARFLAYNPVLVLLTLWAGLRWARPGRATREASGRPALGTAPATPPAAPAAAPPAAPPAASAAAPPAIPAVVVIGYLLYVMVVGGDYKMTFRFIVPVLPLWALWLDDCVSRLGWPRPRLRSGAGRWAWPVLAALVLQGAFLVPAQYRWSRHRAWDLTRRKACGLYLGRYARPGEVLAIHSAGIIPYYSGLRTLDMWGLNDLHIAHEPIPYGDQQLPVGHERMDRGYVFAQEPTFYVDEYFYCVSDSLPDLAEFLFPLQPWDRRYLAPYRARSVRLTVDDGTGPSLYYFNFLERENR